MCQNVSAFTARVMTVSTVRAHVTASLDIAALLAAAVSRPPGDCLNFAYMTLATKNGSRSSLAAAVAVVS